jgi:hypothetical protein
MQSNIVFVQWDRQQINQKDVYHVQLGSTRIQRVILDVRHVEKVITKVNEVNHIVIFVNQIIIPIQPLQHHVIHHALLIQPHQLELAI